MRWGSGAQRGRPRSRHRQGGETWTSAVSIFMVKINQGKRGFVLQLFLFV